MGDGGMKAFSEVLKINTTLTELNLRSDEQSDLKEMEKEKIDEQRTA